MRNVYKVLAGETEVERPLLRYIGVNVGILLKWILKKQGVRMWAGFIWLRIGTSGGLL
jgi:hypothetical protein